MREMVPVNGSGVVPGPAGGLLAVVRDAIAGLRDLELWRVPEAELLDLARSVEAASRALAGVSVRLTGELVQRGAAETLGARSPAAMLHEALGVTAGQARGRVRVAAAVLPSETPTGHTVPPALPEVLASLDAGAIAEEQAVVIVDAITALPAAVDTKARVMCRDLLLAQAGQGDVLRLRRVAEQLRTIIHPDGTPDAKDPADRAELHIGHRRTDGLTPIRGLLDPLTSEALRHAIEPLAEPKPIDENTPDTRPAPARRAHALGEILHRYLACGRGPIDGGVRPQVVITIPLDSLLKGLGSGWADYTGPITAATARMLACDANLIPQILGTDSVVLDQGRAVRLFPPEIRRAITTRDRGCSFPGCDIPPDWCDAHHILWWERDLGPTAEHNGCLLCKRHHTLIHQGHWHICLTDTGRPEFIPPPWIDPAQTPRTNHHWTLPTIAA